jgi:hypothetical protein
MDFGAQVVPEPSSVVMLGMGLLGAGCWVGYTITGRRK